MRKVGGGAFAESLKGPARSDVLTTIDALRTVCEPGRWALVGSLAVNHFATQQWGSDYTGGEQPVGDVDIAVQGLDTLSPSRMHDLFEVSHWHQPGPRGVYFALFTRSKPHVKVDGFTLHHPNEVATVPVGGGRTYDVPVLNPEAQLVATVDFLQRRMAGQAGGGDPRKYTAQINVLAHLVNQRNTSERAKKLWQGRHGNEGEGLYQTARRLEEAVQNQSPPLRSSRLGYALRLLSGRGCGGCDPAAPVMSRYRELALHLGWL